MTSGDSLPLPPARRGTRPDTAANAASSEYRYFLDMGARLAPERGASLP